MESRQTSESPSEFTGTSAYTVCSGVWPGRHRLPISSSFTKASEVPIAFQPRTTMPSSPWDTTLSIGVSASASARPRSTSRNLSAPEAMFWNPRHTDDAGRCWLRERVAAAAQAVPRAA
nr:hypothetical protein [Amycolatopsis sp. DSM 110486]